MANEEHLNILKQGVEVWNAWREANPTIRPSLKDADLRNVNVRDADLRGAVLFRTDLRGADLRGAQLNNAYLPGVKLNNADLTGVKLNNANLGGAKLGNANLSGANFKAANLSGSNFLFGADLSGANLRDAYLVNANLIGASLSSADLSNATVGYTIFGDLDLHTVRGLETLTHTGPSHVTIHTIFKSQGQIPEIFLRGTGAPDIFIEYMRSLTATPIDYYTCFISYTRHDHDLAERLHNDLQCKGVRCWFAPHDLKPGDLYRQRIDESIRVYDKLILLLSVHSVESDWVRFEVEAALEKERQRKQHNVLFPLRLDDAVLTTTHAWAAGLRRERHIGDFTRWKDHDHYRRAFDKMLHDLQNRPPDA